LLKITKTAKAAINNFRRKAIFFINNARTIKIKTHDKG